ncbi:MAG: hypothetical protein JW808_01595, partial [Victivallales bacterium]|nr:hypothetical protein [Victivallales bacterium]
GRIGRKPLHRLVKGLDSFVSSAWICPADGRLYTRYHEYKPAWRDAGAPLPGADLACCKEVGIEGI